MPFTADALVRIVKAIKKEDLSEPQSPFQHNRAIRHIRRIIREKGVPFIKLRVLVAVWLFKRLTHKDPTVVEVIAILNMHSQTEVNEAISFLSHGQTKGRKGILVKSDNGNRLSVNYSIAKRF